MKLQKWLSKMKIEGLTIKAGFLDIDFDFSDKDKAAAWDLYVELLTRVSTQPLAPNEGDEATALGSLFQLFDISRDIMKKYGRSSIEFTKIAVVVLNHVIRPFTAKWQDLILSGAFSDPQNIALFRSELIDIQQNMKTYTQMLAEMAGVEDITNLAAIVDE